jgi:3-keto-disaccharide hydrolase/WD40-like Beta Propeller Repeat
MTSASYSHRLTFALCCLIACSGCGGSGDKPPVVETPADAQSRPAAPEPAPLPDFETATCLLYTAEPGAFVFVDGLPVSQADGKPATTPCRVTAAPGAHAVTLAREGRADRSLEVIFGDNVERFIEEPETSGPSADSLLSVPLLNLSVGEPVALSALNSPGRELDPFVTPDGLSIWFAADRAEGRGIYVATRQGPLEQFGPPRLLELTRGSDLPASPSVTGDQTSVVYVIPDKARIWALTRSNPLGDFDERVPLFFRSEAVGIRWPSAQIHSDGLRIYFTRETTGGTETRVVIRESPADRFKTERIVAFPGLHPCLSADGLRQYAFDGAALRRARRSTVQQSFSAPETVMELALPGYSASPLRRQYFVSDDEQWMFYSDDPDNAGDLYVVRLANGPGWGVALRGEPIEPKTLAQVETMSAPAEPEGSATEPTPAPEPEERPDPRAQPLPYTQFRTQLVKLLQHRDYDAAAELVASAGDTPGLSADADMISWDSADVARLQQFWQDVIDAVKAMQPGDEFRIGSVRVEFVRFEDGQLVAKARTRELRRPLHELDPLDILGIVNRVADENDVDDQVRAATFLLYEPDVPASSRDRHVADGGEQAAAIVEQFADRLLRQARGELERDNAAAAVPFIDRIESEFPATAVAGQAGEVRNQLYAAAWRIAGSRQWQTGPDGEYTAGPERAEDALLVSRQQYERFELTMEYRTNTRDGQGGVFFRYAGSGRLYGRCFKIQLSNDRGVNPDEYCTGSLFGIEAPDTNVAGDMGQWNTFRMRVDGEDFSVWINDRIVIDTDAVDDQIPEAGFVALDGIPGGISYRKVLLTELPPQ